MPDAADHAEPPPSQWGARAATRRSRAAAVALLAAVIAVVLGARVLGPSQLYQNTDECKTVAFTADIAVNGEWILPRDGTGTRTLKPPLVNWIGAAPVRLGWHTELAYKLPSILSALGLAWIVVAMGQRLFPRGADRGNHPDDPEIARGAPTLALAAAACLIASTGLVKHIYFFRPDILMAFCLAAGWMGATICLERRDQPDRVWWALLMWAGAAAAGLAKGPYALLVPIYALIAGPVIHRSWRALGACGWWWGVPLMIAPALAWLYAAYRVDPEHVSGPLLGGELLERMPGQGERPMAFKPLLALYNVPLLVVERFAPWGVFALLAFVFVPPWRWRTHAVAPAILWALVVYGALILTAGRAGSYILMATPALAILAAYALARIAANIRWHGVHIAAAALVAAGGIGAREAFFSRGARTGLGDRVAAFAREADAIAGGAHVIYVDTGHNPVASLMGRHSMTVPADPQRVRDAWFVAPLDSVPPGAPEPELTTESLIRLKSEGAEVHSRSEGLALLRDLQ